MVKTIENSIYVDNAINSSEYFYKKQRQHVGLALSTVALITTLSNFGCSAKPVVDEKLKDNTEVESETKVELSASEKSYAEYLKTLSPEQISLRESLNPDALAEMDETQMTEAFTIYADEVVVDGNIDPKLYAEAFTARFQAMSNSGISEIEYEKWGGIDKFGADTIDIVANKYFTIQSEALFGYVGTDEIAHISLSRGVAVDTIMKGGLSPQPKERYRLIMTVKPNSIEITEKSDSLISVRFGIHLSDNWEEDTMYEATRLKGNQTDADIVQTISELYIDEAGAVLPSSKIKTE